MNSLECPARIETMKKREGLTSLFSLAVVTVIVYSCRTESPARTFAVRLYPSVGDHFPTFPSLRPNKEKIDSRSFHISSLS